MPEEDNTVIFNTLMKPILLQIQYNNVPSHSEYPIRQNTSCGGEPFWSVGDFCGLLDADIKPQHDLIALEWDGNEIRIDNSLDVLELVLYSLGILKDWKAQMEDNYREIPFDIVLSVDFGDETIPPSATLRFWAVRNQVHYINPSVQDLDSFCQPVLMEQVNYE